MYGSEFVDLGSTIRKLMERVQLPNRKEKKKVCGATVRNCHTLQMFYLLIMILF